MRATQTRRRQQTAMWSFCFQGDVWFWFYKPTLPNGWNAGVKDDSQHYEPPKPTRYLAFAAAEQMEQVLGEEYPDFQTAKREALNLAMSQEDISRRRLSESRPVKRKPSDDSLEDPTSDFSA